MTVLSSSSVLVTKLSGPTSESCFRIWTSLSGRAMATAKRATKTIKNFILLEVVGLVVLKRTSKLWLLFSVASYLYVR